MRLPGKVVLVVALIGLLAAGVAVAKKKHHHRGNLPRGPYPSISGCPVFPASSAPANAPSAADESAWNQDISAAPADPNSAAYISYITAHGGDLVHPDFGSPREYGFPYAVVGKRQKRTKVNFTAYGDESDHGAYRVPFKSLVEGGQSSDGDRHVLTVDAARCRLYELGRAFARKKPKPHWNADVGVIWDLRSAALRPEGFTSADAAGLPIFPGLVRYDEVASGHIDHALRFTVSKSQQAYLHPATHDASSSTDPNLPPMGLRLRLKASFNTSSFTGQARVVLDALKKYGMIVADNGSNWFISGAVDTRWNDTDLNQLKTVPGSAFEVVNTGESLHK
jgi:hypothetical protein